MSIALCRARQLMRRTQTDLNFKKAVEAGAPSRLQGPPSPTRAPILEKLGAVFTTEKVEDLDGRTSIVHQHFMESDPRQKEISEWIWQRWSYEVLQSLPTIDSERVRGSVYAVRKRTSCADDHLVIEMLREMDLDVWETLARRFQFRMLNHWSEDQDMMWVGTTAFDGHEKNWETHKERSPPDCHSADDVQVVLRSVTTVCGPGFPFQVWPAARSCPWPPSPWCLHLAQNGGASE